ncbi:CPBP family intramembrane glutamic endopeptidase [Streptomyces cyanogenus]|uniref:CAAX amino terminal protease self- immunity n=1 Tax=Streptomyces cyanogenus TaxID=80860 RepID=A0ABX7TY43_STRCY|nr:CPBP family intramembrane glutamic endopeptidase [Streptomyces cyanogenus]QTE00111.1 CAAX amino terminal protease self- immunity [Streptomyces cyanogenus]
MTSLIHIPELRAASAVALALCALSSLALASHLHVRFLDRRGVHTLHVYAAVLAVVTGYGLLVLGPAALYRGPVWGLAAGPLAGAVLAAPVAAADTAITRRLGRRAARSAPPAGPPRAVRTTRAVGLAARVAGARTAGTTERRWTPSHRDTDVALPPGWLVAVGALEECVFRGVLTGEAMALTGWAVRIAVLTLATAAFALSHLFFGWTQVAAKLPLALAGLALTLATGDVLGAITVHALFNLRIWRYQNTVRSAGSRAVTP